MVSNVSIIWQRYSKRVIEEGTKSKKETKNRLVYFIEATKEVMVTVEEVDAAGWGIYPESGHMFKTLIDPAGSFIRGYTATTDIARSVKIVLVAGKEELATVRTRLTKTLNCWGDLKGYQKENVCGLFLEYSLGEVPEVAYLSRESAVTAFVTAVCDKVNELFNITIEALPANVDIGEKRDRKRKGLY